MTSRRPPSARRRVKRGWPRPGALPLVGAPLLAGPLLLAGAFLLAGCGGEPEPSAPPPPHPPAASVAPAGPGEQSGSVVEVALVEYAIGMPSRLPAGPAVLRLSNVGFEVHNLKLVDAGSGSLLWEAEPVNAGENRLAELVLEPGEYTMLCDLAGHDSRGMRMSLLVEDS